MRGLYRAGVVQLLTRARDEEAGRQLRVKMRKLKASNVFLWPVVAPTTELEEAAVTSSSIIRAAGRQGSLSISPTVSSPVSSSNLAVAATKAVTRVKGSSSSDWMCVMLLSAKKGVSTLSASAAAISCRRCPRRSARCSSLPPGAVDGRPLGGGTRPRQAFWGACRAGRRRGPHTGHHRERWGHLRRRPCPRCAPFCPPPPAPSSSQVPPPTRMTRTTPRATEKLRNGAVPGWVCEGWR